MRASGVRDVLIYRRDHRCSHHVETNADGWTDDVRLSDEKLRNERACRQIEVFQPYPIAERDFALIAADEM
jgi:hypothetical protein